MKHYALLAALSFANLGFAQVDLINKVKDNGSEAPLGYEWETVVDIGDEIDVESSLENLRKRGYKVKVSSESQSSC